VKSFRPTTWNQLTELLYADSWRPALGRFRSRYAYRGMVDSNHRLSTTLSQLGARYSQNESHLLRNFRKYAHGSTPGSPVPTDSIWNWLSLAQHHGLPTRLLDWTYSPFVALHFATFETATFDRDGVVWCIDYAKAHQLIPPALRKVLKSESADVFTAEMLDRVMPTLPALDRLGKRKPFVLFLEPPSLDDRIVNQFALFSLMSSPTASLNDWLRQHHTLAHPVIIPAQLKWEIRDKLDQANVSERVLFPGLDGLCKLLKRYYSPRRDYQSKTARQPQRTHARLSDNDTNGASRPTSRPQEYQSVTNGIRSHRRAKNRR
jgi:hypothetical protein